MAAHALPLSAMQCGVQQMPLALQAEPTKMVEHGLPGRVVTGQIAPGTAAAHEVENGVEDPSQRMSARSATSWQWREVPLNAGPFRVSQVAGIRSAHTE